MTGGASRAPTAARYFAALRRPLDNRDRSLEVNSHFEHVAAGQETQWQNDPTQARLVADADGVTVAAMPNRKGGLCEVAIVSNPDGTLNSESAMCGPGPQSTPAMDDTPILVRPGLRGAGPWVGLLPDGVSHFRAVLSDGTEESPALSSDRGFAFGSAQSVTAFKFVDSHGQVHSWTVGQAPRA